MKKNYKLGNCIPAFNENNIAYKREEHDGVIIMISKKHPELQQLTYNKTSMVVAEFCDGKTKINDIVKSLHHLYKNVSQDVIEEDVINILHIFWRLGFVEWCGENPYLELYRHQHEDTEFQLLTEEEVVEWMLAEEPIYMSPMSIKNMNYTDAVIKQNIFAFFESYYVISDSHGNKMMISLITPLGNQSYFRVGIISGNAKMLESSQMSDFLIWAKEITGTLSQAIGDVTGILLYEEEDEKWGEMLGMQYCGTLEKEVENRNIRVYNYSYES